MTIDIQKRTDNGFIHSSLNTFAELRVFNTNKSIKLSHSITLKLDTHTHSQIRMKMDQVEMRNHADYTFAFSKISFGPKIEGTVAK